MFTVSYSMPASKNSVVTVKEENYMYSTFQQQDKSLLHNKMYEQNTRKYIQIQRHTEIGF